MPNYQIFTDAAADMSRALLAGLPNIQVIPMHLEIGDQEYTYGPDGDITPQSFYALQRLGYSASSSQINPVSYTQAFEPVRKAGMDNWISVICQAHHGQVNRGVCRYVRTIFD